MPRKPAGKYKVEVKSSPGWKSFPLCSLDISIGNSNEEGEKLAALLRWLETRFEFCLINLGDSLYRHNMADANADPQRALREATALGDRWINDNMAVIARLRIPFRIVRWQEWLDDDAFAAWNSHIRGLYFREAAFRHAVELDILDFMARPAQSEAGRNISRDNCLNYILEEMAVHCLMANTLRLARIYPSDRLRAACYLTETENGLEREAFIRAMIKRRKNAFPAGKSGAQQSL